MSLTNLDIRVAVDMNSLKIGGLDNGSLLEDAVTFEQLDGAVTDITNLETLSGVAGAVNLGTFTGTTITDNSNIKTALQELETAVENAGTSYSAGNGLTLAATTFKLGGTISEDTTLDFASTYRFTIANAKVTTIASEDITITSTNEEVVINSDAVTINGDGAILLPAGDIVGRPTGVNAKFRYNTMYGRPEWYGGGAWKQCADTTQIFDIGTMSSLYSNTLNDNHQIYVNDFGTNKRLTIEEHRQYLYRKVTIYPLAGNVTLSSSNIDNFAGTFISCTGTGTATITLNSTIPTGTQYVIANNRTGTVTVTASTGTIRSLDSNTKITAGGGVATITCVASNTFHLAGTLEA
jgi:hypothetical protein